MVGSLGEGLCDSFAHKCIGASGDDANPGSKGGYYECDDALCEFASVYCDDCDNVGRDNEKESQKWN